MAARDSSPRPGGASASAQALPHGADLLHDPTLNKGTAFTEEERERLGLRGLLPPRVHSLDEQVERVLENLRGRTSDLERYVDLAALQERNETLFYRVVMDHLAEMMPIVYTPTVGRACQVYGHIFQRPRGVFVTPDDRGRVAELLRNWPRRDVRVVVVTDGERILGLGDLGASGMGIPVGKLALYVACAGVHPAQCLPVTLDVGTENEALLHDPLYLGIRERRLRGDAYDALVEEFVDATQTVFPRPLVQFEDFANRNAFRLLERYRERICTFDDDIQGTGSVALAALLSALRVTGGRLRDQRVLFLGAGEAGIGIAHAIVAELVAGGLTLTEARRRCWLLDTHGLVVSARQDLPEHKRPFAHDHPHLPGLLEAIEALRPSAIVGVSGAPGSFDEPAIEAMARIQQRPIVFALSNPTSKSECTAEQAYAWSGGRAIFASGSPFGPVQLGGHRRVPAQCNNAYVFPGLGLGAIHCGAERVTDEMFGVAAHALCAQASDAERAEGRVLPPFERIRDVSVAIAVAVAKLAWQTSLARTPPEDDPEPGLRAGLYQPSYPTYV